MGLNLFDILGHAADGYHIAHTQHVAEEKATADHAQQLKEYQDAQASDFANKKTLQTQAEGADLARTNAQGLNQLNVAETQSKGRIDVAKLKQMDPVRWAGIQVKYAGDMAAMRKAHLELGYSEAQAAEATDEMFAHFLTFPSPGGGAPPSATPSTPSSVGLPLDSQSTTPGVPAAPAAVPPPAPVVSSPPAYRPGLAPNYSAPAAPASPAPSASRFTPTTVQELKSRPTTITMNPSSAPPVKPDWRNQPSPKFTHKVENDNRISTDKGKHEDRVDKRLQRSIDAGIYKTDTSADTSTRNTDANIQGRKDIETPRLEFDRFKFNKTFNTLPPKDLKALVDKADKKNYMTTGEKLELSTLEKDRSQIQRSANAKNLFDQPLMKPDEVARRLRDIDARKQAIGHAIDKRHDDAVKKAKMEANGISPRKGSVTGSLHPADPRLTTKMGSSVGVRPRPKPQGMKIFPKATRNNLTPQEKKLLGAF